MQWIKYQIIQCTVENENVLITKKVGYSDENLAIAQNEAYNGEYTIEADEKEYPNEVEDISEDFVTSMKEGFIFDCNVHKYGRIVHGVIGIISESVGFDEVDDTSQFFFEINPKYNPKNTAVCQVIPMSTEGFLCKECANVVLEQDGGYIFMYNYDFYALSIIFTYICDN